MIVDQSQPGAFAQVGMFAGGSVWTFLTSPPAVVRGPYRIDATDHHLSGSVATDYHAAGSVATDHQLPGTMATDAFWGEA